jgi:hypothetical protein
MTVCDQKVLATGIGPDLMTDWLVCRCLSVREGLPCL